MNRAALLALACLLACGAARADDPPAPRCKYVQVARLPIRYLGPGLVPAVDGVINGTPATMLVDTGAGFSSLTMTAATRRKLTLFLTGTRVSGIGGIARAYTTHVREMAVGATQGAIGLDMTVIADTAFTPAYDAILGASFLMQADLELDLAEKRLRFFRPLDCDHATFNIWKNDNTISVPLIDSPYDRSDNPHFKVLVNGVELDALIDTGAGLSFLVPSAARRLGIALDGPGVTRLPDAGGVGSERVASWSAPVQTVQIGDEIIQQPQLGIVAMRGRAVAELYLGQDFLRTHRVLFAMGQKKLYLSYRGGDVFPHGAGIEPWMRAEAENGNPDAEYLLATRYTQGRGVPRDPAQARAWLDKATAAGEPHASMELGLAQLKDGQAAAAIPRLRSALDQLPSDAYLPLWLYLARVRNGEAELARRELASSYMAGKEDQWPEPIARFYLGKLDAAGLLARTDGGGDKLIAFMQACTANNFMGQWYAAQGDTARAEPLQAAVRAECDASAIVKRIRESIEQKQ